MRINIYSPGFGLSPAMVQHIETRVSMALETASSQINQVVVRLDDINGSRGGLDKQCRITVHHAYLPPFSVEVVNQDLYMAVTEAAGKAKENLWRHVIRRRTLRRDYIKRPMRQMMA